MDGTETIALVFVAAWLGILTLVVVLMIRQIGLLTVRLRLTGSTFDVSADGLGIGEVVPEEISSKLPVIGGLPTYVLLISPTCNQCRELATELRGRLGDLRNIVALVPGLAEPADSLAAMLPSEVQAIRDPEASRFAKLLGIRSTPFAIEITHGLVTGKAYIHGTADLLDLVNKGRVEGPLLKGNRHVG